MVLVDKPVMIKKKIIVMTFPDLITTLAFGGVGEADDFPPKLIHCQNLMRSHSFMFKLVLPFLANGNLILVTIKEESTGRRHDAFLNSLEE